MSLSDIVHLYCSVYMNSLYFVHKCTLPLTHIMQICVFVLLPFRFLFWAICCKTNIFMLELATCLKLGYRTDDKILVLCGRIHICYVLYYFSLYIFRADSRVCHIEWSDIRKQRTLSIHTNFLQKSHHQSNKSWTVPAQDYFAVSQCKVLALDRKPVF